MNDGDLLSLGEAAGLFPRRRGKKVSTATIYRWSVAGVRGVKLRTVQAGSVRSTTRQYVEEFIAALTSQRDGVPASSQMPAAAQRRRAEAVSKELDRVGI